MTATMILLAALTANFAQETGKIRPALHSSGLGPTICSQTQQDLDDIKAMGFKYARTHDWALVNANERVCDYFHIFPLMHHDAKDPRNYVFEPTDYLLKRTREEAGLDIFFRLGTSIEHSGYKTHFNTRIPEDFDKVAETFAATVRHYNRGWANGHKWNIKYWEIWNEPEGIECMWAPKEGVNGLWTPETDAKRIECRDLFIRFYVTCLKRLKDEFGDSIKVGGPALCGCRIEWIKLIFEASRKAGVMPDFLSWHDYVNDPMKFNVDAVTARKLCTDYGIPKCELMVNEWHYFGHDDYTWDDMQRCSDPKVKARIWSGPRSHNGIRSACFTLSTLANIQRSELDQAYWYGCMHTGDWGFKDEVQSKYKVFFALKLFGDLVKGYPTMCASASENGVTLLAVKAADGRRKALLVSDYEAKAGATLKVSVTGATKVVKATVLDYTHDLESVPAELHDGVLSLKKSDANAAAYFVEFE